MGVLLFSFLLVVSIIAYTAILPTWTPPGNVIEALRAIINVAGVILGFAGIMFGNMILVVSQDISEGRRHLSSWTSAGPLGRLEQYRRDLVENVIVVFIALLLSIAFSIVSITTVPELPGTLFLSTTRSLGLPLYFLFAGVLTMLVSLRQLLP